MVSYQRQTFYSRLFADPFQSVQRCCHVKCIPRDIEAVISVLRFEVFIGYVANGIFDRDSANVDREGRFCMFWLLGVVSRLVLKAIRRQYTCVARDAVPHFGFLLQFSAEKVMLLRDVDWLENLHRQHMTEGDRIMATYIGGILVSNCASSSPGW